MLTFHPAGGTMLTQPRLHPTSDALATYDLKSWNSSSDGCSTGTSPILQLILQLCRGHTGHTPMGILWGFYN